MTNQNNKKTQDLNDALLIAVQTGNLSLVELLLNNGVNANYSNGLALHWAALNGYLDIIELLINEGASIEVAVTSALPLALSEGHDDVVNFLEVLKMTHPQEVSL